MFMFVCVCPVGLLKPLIRLSLCSPDSTEDSKDGRTRASLDKETYQNHFTVNSQKANCNLGLCRQTQIQHKVHHVLPHCEEVLIGFPTSLRSQEGLAVN